MNIQLTGKTTNGYGKLLLPQETETTSINQEFCCVHNSLSIYRIIFLSMQFILYTRKWKLHVSVKLQQQSNESKWSRLH